METPKNRTEHTEAPVEENPIILVAGLSENIDMYSDVARLFPDKSKKFTFLSTHPEEEAKRQQEISGAVEYGDASKDSLDDGESTKKNTPIMSVRDAQYFANQENPENMTEYEDNVLAERHKNFESRVQLAEKALREAVENSEGTTNEITIVGHSAGGFATLAALARVVASSEKSLPKIHAVLIAPAIPGEVKQWLAVEPTFIGVVMRDFFRKIGKLSSSYLVQLFSKRDITPSDADLAKILGPMQDADFEDRVLKGAVPIAGGEGLDLINYTEAFKDNGTALEFQDWPKNVTIDVVIPTNDQWVSVNGQKKLVTDVLKAVAGENAQGHLLEGEPHLPLGEKDAAEKVAEIIARD
ncbi:alpha/beta hydrolase [Candidatus Kaiserbacteria bacterium]|nr:MAG: alpha/beta hydrolase [Candidatus Kaiserbacteria bacterium]